MLKLIFSVIAFVGLAVTTVQPATAQQQGKQIRFPCGTGLVHNDFMPGLQGGFASLKTLQNGLLHQTSMQVADLQQGELNLTFVGHATFLIQSPAGVKVITDYNDYYRASVLPDIATMNTQRSNHSTETIEPSITHVLRSWSDTGNAAKHDVTLKDVRVYNTPTNLTGGEDFFDVSSVFVVQSHGLCVAHMGHLRHLLNQKQFSKIGRIDVLLIPVDRRVTQSYEELVHNVKGINPRLIVPMHFNAMFTVDEFLQDISKVYPVKRIKSHKLTINRKMLPMKTEVLFITPKELSGNGFGSRL